MEYNMCVCVRVIESKIHDLQATLTNMRQILKTKDQQIQSLMKESSTLKQTLDYRYPDSQTLE